jgi:hypothetical protein
MFEISVSLTVIEKEYSILLQENWAGHHSCGTPTLKYR